MTPAATRLARIAGLLLVTGVLIWPALYNHQPFFSTDTSAYIRGADAGIHSLTGATSSWSLAPNTNAVVQKTEPAATPTAQAATSAPSDRVVFAGRSVYYGMLLYAGQLAGDFWLVVCVQGLLLAITLVIVLRAWNLMGARFSGVTTALLSVTPVTLFVSCLMPDLFAAMTILCCALCLMSFNKSRAQTAFLFAVLTCSLLFHATHILLALFALVLGLIANALKVSGIDRRGIVVIAGALVLSYAGEQAFNAGVRHFTGQPPLRPPFLMARVIEDGPGYRYLKAECPRSGFVVCRYVDRLPLTANDFLWGEDPARTVFITADPQTQRAMSAEQMRFVLVVVRKEPWNQIVASIGNAFRQATMIGVPAFEYSAFDREVFKQKLPAGILARTERTAAYTGAMPVYWLSLASYVTAIIGLAYIVVALLRGRLSALRLGAGPVRLVTFVLLGVAANAFICGAMAAPFDRYQARVVWLVPLCALLMDFRLRQTWWSKLFSRTVQ